jgi:hypothetical protein
MIKTFESFVENPNIINDPIYRECIHLAHQSKAEGERYGAVLIKNGEILGRGYNRGIAHAKFKLDRILKQGYANHAEVEAMNDALINGKDIRFAKIYVAGYFNKTKTLFFKKEFTCMRCIPYFEKYEIENIYVPIPSGWRERNIEDCKVDALQFKGGTHDKRLKALIGNYNVSLVKEKKMLDIDPYGEEKWSEDLPEGLVNDRLRHTPGVCFNCGNENITYGDSELYGNQMEYEYSCDDCDSDGVEVYVLEFLMNVRK